MVWIPFPIMRIAHCRDWTHNFQCVWLCYPITPNELGVRLYSSNHNKYDNGHEDYDIFYSEHYCWSRHRDSNSDAFRRWILNPMHKPILLWRDILRGIDIISPSQQKGELANVITLLFPTDYVFIISHLNVFVKRISEKIFLIFLRKCHCVAIDTLRKILIYLCSLSKTGRYGNITQEHI